jgi:hypothetical protein
MTLSSVERIDVANIGLMLLSCLLAFILPFELFLFSYAVLGPLHYLTEIGWLHQKGYFTTGKNDFIFLGLLGLFITLGFLGFSSLMNGAEPSFIYVAFLSAGAMVLIKDNTLKVIAIILLFFSALLFHKASFYEVFFAIYLPTVIHVFLFTGLFILYGALKNKSLIGVASLLVFSGCAISFFLIRIDYSPFLTVDYIRKSYSGFVELNRVLINFLGLENLGEFNRQTVGRNVQVIFGSEIGYTVMRFIAFAYTYHYLNWFSKTSVIKWHKVPKKTLIAVIAIWGASIILYAYNYEVGLKWLFLLSFLHVLLEFPLNFRSIIGIGQEISRLGSSKTATVQK